MKMFRVLRCPKAIGLFIVLISAGSLAMAYTAEYVFGLLPCILCLYQRIPYAVTIGLGILVLVLKHKPAYKILIGLSALTYWAGAAIAAFHVGVEQRWWAGTDECESTLPTEGSLEELKNALLNAPVVQCKDVQWELFGLSMAGYNVIFSLGLGALCMLSVFLITRSTNTCPHKKK